MDNIDYLTIKDEQFLVLYTNVTYYMVNAFRDQTASSGLCLYMTYFVQDFVSILKIREQIIK